MFQKTVWNRGPDRRCTLKTSTNFRTESIRFASTVCLWSKPVLVHEMCRTHRILHTRTIFIHKMRKEKIHCKSNGMCKIIRSLRYARTQNGLFTIHTTIRSSIENVRTIYFSMFHTMNRILYKKLRFLSCLLLYFSLTKLCTQHTIP